VFCDKSAAILQPLRKHFWNSLLFLQLSAPLPVGKDKNVCVLMKVSLPAGWSQCSADIQRFGGDMDLTAWKWRTEET